MSNVTINFAVTHHGSISLVRPLSKSAREHLEENTGDEAQWFGGALVVEPRFLTDLIETLREQGWRVH